MSGHIEWHFLHRDLHFTRKTGGVGKQSHRKSCPNSPHGTACPARPVPERLGHGTSQEVRTTLGTPCGRAWTSLDASGEIPAGSYMTFMIKMKWFRT